MTAVRRRRLLTATLTLSALVCAACTTPGAETALTPTPQVRPAQSESYLTLGNRLLAAREPALAMQAFTASMSVEGISAEALTGAGIAAQQQGMLGAARRYFEHGRDLAPESPIAHSNLGVVLFRLKEYDDARSAFRIALALSGGDSEAVRRNFERAESALAALGEGHESDPALAQRVVRLGTDEFRLTALPETEQETAARNEAD